VHPRGTLWGNGRDAKICERVLCERNHVGRIRKKETEEVRGSDLYQGLSRKKKVGLGKSTCLVGIHEGRIFALGGHNVKAE